MTECLLVAPEESPDYHMVGIVCSTEGTWKALAELDYPRALSLVKDDGDLIDLASIVVVANKKASDSDFNGVISELKNMKIKGEKISLDSLKQKMIEVYGEFQNIQELSHKIDSSNVA